jgi:hypothetical protein
MKSVAICALAGAIVAILSWPAKAQGLALDSQAPGDVRIGPVTLAPVFQLTELGIDTNPYNRSPGSNPVGDFTSRMSPSLDASLRTPHLRARSRSLFEIYYFKALPELRAVDSDNAGQVDLVMNRLTLNFIGRHATTRFSRNLEIDAIARRRTDDATLGAEVRLTGKTSIEASLTRSHLKYDPDSLYLNTDLAEVLNHASASESIALRYAATPLTTFAVEVGQGRARFDTAVDRNADEFQVTPSVEFSPFAIVSGRASVGFLKRTFAAGTPTFNGTSAAVDLSYILLGRTRFTVSLRRQLQYSYLPGVSDYVEAGASVTVTQRLGDSWDVGGTFGRSRLAYRAPNVVAGLPVPQTPDETVITPEFDLGYNLKRARVGFYAHYDERSADVPTPFRGYQRYRIGSTVKYAF